ncbi:hypothetical protein [Bythopirellula goksoeyrii]|nr:hypothetical protein [Bythopirellula goksoeyrii]
METEHVSELIRQAREQVQAEQAVFEKSLNKMFEDVDAAIAAIQEGHTLGEKETLAALKRLAPRLLELASEVIRSHHEVEANALNYEEELTRAIPVFLDAARAFRVFAEEEPYRDLALQYQLLAESLEAIAQKFTRLKGQIPSSLSEVDANLRYIEHTALFLGRLEEVIFLLDEADPSTERFIASLLEYTNAFERLREQLEAFHAATTKEFTVELNKVEEASQDPIASQAPHSRQSDLNPEVKPSHTQLASYRAPTPQWSPPAKSPQKSSLLEDPFGEGWDDPFGEDRIFLSERDLASLAGVWRLGTKPVCVALSRQGQQLKFGLYFSKQIPSATGTIGIESGVLKFDQLIFAMWNGQRLDVSDAEIAITDASTLQIFVRAHKLSSDNRFIPLNSMHQWTLHRLSHYEIERLKEVHSRK